MYLLLKIYKSRNYIKLLNDIRDEDLEKYLQK